MKNVYSLIVLIDYPYLLTGPRAYAANFERKYCQENVVYLVKNRLKSQTKGYCC